MSNVNDFVIENGVLTKYTGPGGNVVIPEGVTKIGSKAFWGCESMTAVTIPEGVTSIDFGAFWECTGLKEITIPEGVTTIGEYAFTWCRNLTKIVLPKSIEMIDCGALAAGAEGVVEILVPKAVVKKLTYDVLLYSLDVRYILRVVSGRGKPVLLHTVFAAAEKFKKVRTCKTYWESGKADFAQYDKDVATSKRFSLNDRLYAALLRMDNPEGMTDEGKAFYEELLKKNAKKADACKALLTERNIL
ncbi:MAG: leucine-rich repeat domain-containing protein [Ruminococcaceae bacterium]|nr:leucine-rich repeat domain-containing protein [Oscillospiraceae bacterium]